MLSWCWFIGKTINRTRERVYIYIYTWSSVSYIQCGIIIGYVSNICSSIKLHVVKPVRVVSFVFEQPRLDSSLGSPSLSLFLPTLPLSSSSFYIHRATSVLSLSFSSSSFFLSFGLPTAERVESRGFLDTLYLAYFDLPEIHWAVHLVDVRCHVWHAAFQTRRSGSSHIPRWSRPRMKEEGAGGM